MNNKSYTGIDYSRFIAAMLVIAIHTSPLASFSNTWDFILTQVIARVAVPFFLMTSGFFMVSRYIYNDGKLITFIKKTAKVYITAIFLYIPVNIYNGYFKMDCLLPNIIKDIVFDGTLYHLWYLPASITGAVIVWFLVKKLGIQKTLVITIFLYLTGLFGDSYYGIARKIPLFDGFYKLVFQVSAYTRNGIFFAPVFMVLGGIIAGSRKKITPERSLCGFVASMVLMVIESLVLHYSGMQRHSSMYIFLLPCMYFLFNLVLCFNGRRPEGIRTLSLVIYIIHPLVIIIVRMAAKLCHMQGLFASNSIVHYITVCFISVLSGMAAVILWNKYNKEKTVYNTNTGRAWLEIDLDNLEYNVKVLKRMVSPGCQLMAVVKAGAYGHGAFWISTYLDKIGIHAFAVATADEGIKLRKYGIRGEILVLGYTDTQRAYELAKYNLTQTLIDFEYAKDLDRQGITINVHIKIDTGMHRLGIPSEAFTEVKRVFRMKNLKVRGMFTHLCCPDSMQNEDIEFTKGQINSFYSLAYALEEDGINLPGLHIQSSYGILNYPGIRCSYARAGIALYGVLSTEGNKTKLEPGLRPVLSLKSRVVLIRKLEKGSSFGYGRAFTAGRDSRIAILSIGYGDGYPRNLSCGKGSALICGYKVPVVGMVCMDQLAVDITDTLDISVGDIATLIDTDSDSRLSAPGVAGSSGSTSNELLCRMGTRLPVVIKPDVSI